MSILHIAPNEDSHPHDTDSGGQCDCNPAVEFRENGDTLVIHNAWDGREIFEELDGGKG